MRIINFIETTKTIGYEADGGILDTLKLHK